MTPQQLATLKTAIAADQALNGQPMSNAGGQIIADAMNLAASPTFVVWRTVVPIDDIMRNGMDWARVDNLSVGKARIWDWMSRLGSLNPSKSNIRAGIDATWVGSAPDLAVRATVYTHCKRNATRCERLFATGTGSDATPGDLAFEGLVTADEVVQARELP